MASIYKIENGDILTTGLKGSKVSDQALRCAKNLATGRDEVVMLDDDDGAWLIAPDGTIEEYFW